MENEREHMSPVIQLITTLAAANIGTSRQGAKVLMKPPNQA